MASRDRLVRSYNQWNPLVRRKRKKYPFATRHAIRNRVHPQILCIGNSIGNASSRLRRGISTRKLTTHAHSSGRANGPVLQFFPEEERRQRSRCDLRSPGGNNSASPLARLFVPADQRTGILVLPLLPPPAVGGGNISFISGSNNSIQSATGGMTISVDVRLSQGVTPCGPALRLFHRAATLAA